MWVRASAPALLREWAGTPVFHHLRHELVGIWGSERRL
jgi:hypothetical protein